MQKNYYQVLGVDPRASSGTITAAYERAKAKLAESGLDDPDTLALLRDAWETLTDPGDRAAYDESLAEPEPPIRLGAAGPRPPAMPSEEPLVMHESESSSFRDRPSFKIGVVVGVVLLALLILPLLFKKEAKAPASTVATSPTGATSTITSSTAVLGENPPPAASPAKYPETGARTAEQVFAEVSPSVVKVVASNESGLPFSTGSGVVTGRGVVITNCHVVIKGVDISVRSGKDSYPATIALADETYDLCQLNVSGLNAPAVEVGSMQYVRTGQKVIAIGAPQGLELTISEGIVSSLRETRLGNLIQTTAPISKGSSGGGLFNISGQLIGITTFQARTGQNLNFAVPADWIAKMEPREGPGPSLE
ncbi:MAG: trypsin-like peptidase domain-containing protein [Betaproteobacteria bacterium]|nr:trypsin-like peptidase domain-containing protein [Betaproteobacteria bacterium]